MSQQTTEHWTMLDAVHHLVDVFDTDTQGRPYRNAIRACMDAYRELPNVFAWKYYTRRYLINTTSMYQTGTVTYDHTGGAYERQLTLAGGTWPVWAAEAQVIVGATRYQVEDRKSDTVLTLTEQASPSEDITTASDYSLALAVVPLPTEVIAISHLVEVNTGYEIDIVTSEGLLQHLVGNYQPQRPYLAAIRASGKRPGQMELEFAPPPNTERAYDLVAKVRPKIVRVLDYSAGTASTTAGSAAVTGTGTVWGSDMVGTVMRFSADDDNLPTTMIGAPLGGTTLRNQYEFQSVVKEVTDSTNIVLTDAAPSTLASVKYQMSDAVDIEIGTMWNYFLSLVEYNYARYQRLDDKEVNTLAARAKQAQLDAQAADSRITSIQPAENNMYYWDLGDWASN